MEVPGVCKSSWKFLEFGVSCWSFTRSLIGRFAPRDYDIYLYFLAFFMTLIMSPKTL